MAKKVLLIIADYSEENLLTLKELCDVCGIQIELAHDFMSHDIVKPMGESPEQWILSYGP